MSFGKNLSPDQMKLARRFEAAGLTSISQAVKAFQRHEDDRIENWKAQLEKIDAENGRPWK